MKKAFKVLMIMVIMLITSTAMVMVYLKTAFPNVGEAPQMTVASTPEVIERGKYLAHSVAVCMDCLSQRDWSKFSGPIVKGTLGRGGEKFGREMGFPGEYFAKNITPSSIGDWTDGEVFRAITAGVDRENNPLFPIMPHHNYGKMDKEDIKAIIAYIRTLPSIENEVPESTSDFPMNIIINTIPKKAKMKPMPSKDDKVNYGEYLLVMAGCFDCHTQQERGKPVKGMDFAGGFKFDMKENGTAYSANITPHKETGIGYWTKEKFVSTFKSFDAEQHEIKPGMQQTPMPWTMYATMDEYDLEAIFAFLQTVKPIENKVVVFEK